MQNQNSRYKWNDRYDDEKTTVYISLANDSDLESQIIERKKELNEIAENLKELNEQRKKESDENKRKIFTNKYLGADSEYKKLNAELKRLEELRLITERNKDTEFKMSRLKDIYSRKEALCIDILRQGVEDGKIISSSTKIEEDIYKLEEFGVYMTVPCFGEMARHAKDIFFDLKVLEREYIENTIPEDIAKQFVRLCATHWKEDASAVIDNTANNLLYVPVSTIKEWHNDSAYRRFPLTEIKEALALYGYTKTNAGRNDYTDRKAGKVIAFWNDRFLEISKKVSLENENIK